MRLLLTGWLLGLLVLLGYPTALVLWLLTPFAGLAIGALLALAKPRSGQHH